VFWLRVVAGVALLAWILTRVDLDAVTVHASKHLTLAVGLATGLLLASQAVAANRWRIILDDPALRWPYLFRLYVVGCFFSLFLPTSVGGDAVRAAAAARSSARGGRAIASVLLDRGFGVAATVAYAIVGLAVSPDAAALLADHADWRLPRWGTIGVVVAAVALTGVALARVPAVRRLWTDGAVGLAGLARSPRRLLAAAALALASQGLILLLWATLAWGVQFHLSASLLLWAVPLVTLSGLLPVTFSGLGVREGLWLLVLGGARIPPADIVVFSLLYFLCMTLVGVVGGIVFVWAGTASRRHG
jgi:hypothetical protein